MKSVRCAIYTRKSSDEGLEQSFNSLDAQREACAAYILSQASEGWTEVKERYDDGGLSGGTLERPGLQRLLADVAARRIDIIVVYKVDRLTRSLLDFAKLVEAFDAADTSFVSVTQSFNTTTSMGRLTLNMLLSFAQFEREVTAERIRDKIAASKARGMWMGGVPPLGYKPDGRSLAIVAEHAQFVRHIFQRYLALGTVRQLEAELREQGIKVPPRTTASGKPIGSGWFSRGLLHLMLRRVTYDGKIAHGDKFYPGTHPAIIDTDMFARVQAKLAENIQGQRRGSRSTRPSLLAGKIVDAAGEPLIATHATKRSPTTGGVTRYRYYVSRGLHQKTSATGLRVPAREIEKLVAARLAELVDDPIELIATAWLDVPPAKLQQLHSRCDDLANELRGSFREAIAALVDRVTIGEQGVEIHCRTSDLATYLDVERHCDAPDTISLRSSARLTRSGMMVKLVQADGCSIDGTPQASLIKQIATARRWWIELRKGELDVTRLAEREKVTASYMTRILRLAFLSPALTKAILAGKQPAHVDVASLKLTDTVAANWADQMSAISSSPRGSLS